MILALRKLVYSSAMITGIRTSLAGALCLLPLVFLPSIAIAQASPSRGAAIIDSMPNAKRIEQAVVSPDGTRVAYIVHATLTVAPVDGAPAKTIEVEGKLPLRGASWSNDSKQLVFIADLPDEVPSAQVWTVSADGGSPTKRAELKGNVDAASFSPDGSKIALLFIEGMPRAAGPLQPMTPLCGRCRRQDLRTAPRYHRSRHEHAYPGHARRRVRLRIRLDARRASLGRNRRAWFRRRELVRRPPLPHRYRHRERCARSTLRSGRLPAHASRPMARTSHSSKA